MADPETGKQGGDALPPFAGEKGSLGAEDWVAAGVPQRRHSAPVVSASPGPLQGLRKEGGGSRFWVLQDGDISEDEEDNVSSSSSGKSISDSDFLCEALLAGFSGDEVRRAETLAKDGSSPSFGSVNVGAGQVVHPRLFPQRIVDAVAVRRSSAQKPWRGPMPKSRVSPKISLGDILVKDLRSGQRKVGQEGSVNRLKLAAVISITPMVAAAEWGRRWKLDQRTGAVICSLGP